MAEEIQPEKKESSLQEKKDVWEIAREKASAEARVELEKAGLSEKEKELVREQLEKEINLMQSTPALQEEAGKKAKKIEFLGEKAKIEHLVMIAKEKGLAFAIKVAKEMNDPYILDIFHDALVREGFYKNFLKQ